MLLFVYLDRNVVSGGQVLTDRGQGGLFNIPDTSVDPIDGVVTLPLAGGFVSAEEKQCWLLRRKGGKGEGWENSIT